MLVWTEAVASSFCGFQQSSCFFSLNIIPNATTSSHSPCAIVITDQTKHIQFYVLIYKGKKRRWKLLQDISNWLILFSQARRHCASGAIHHRNPHLPAFAHKCGNCPVCQQCVTSSIAEVINIKETSRNGQKQHILFGSSEVLRALHTARKKLGALSEQLHMKTHFISEKLW